MSAARPRVLVVGLGLELSGSGRFLTSLTPALMREGVDAQLFVIRSGPLQAELDASDVPYLVAAPDLAADSGRASLGMASFSQLREHIRTMRPDVVHSNLVGVDLVTRLAVLGTRVPVVVSTQHDINPRPWLVNAFRRATVARISGTVACSDSVAEYCRGVMHVPAEKLFVIDNGIDTERLAAAAGPMREPVRFLAMGALVPAKNHALLLDAFALAGETLRGATLTIAGDGPLRSTLESQITELGLAERVRIVPPTPDVASLLRDADAFVQPSAREGLPQAMLEAMAAAKPVVATDVSSHADVLGGGRFGVLVAPDDPAAMAAALGDIARDPDAAARLGEAGLARVREHYSLTRMASEYAALYRRLLGSAT